MAEKFLTSVDLARNELQNAVIQNLATAPASPTRGLVYYNTTTETYEGWDGTAWVDLGGNGSAITALTGGVTATGPGSVAATVNDVGGKTASEVADAVNLAHAQNTDTGTTATSFQVDSGNTGPRVKNSSGEVQLRNSADSAYADLRCDDLTVEGNLTVNGTTTTLNTTTVETGDNEIVLNSEITTAAGNTTGGVAIKRLDADNTTRRDGKIQFDEATEDRFQAVWGVHTAAVKTHLLAMKFTATVGDGVATQFTVTHNLNTRFVTVEVFANSGDYPTVTCDVERTSVNAVRLTFSPAIPTTDQYAVVITG